MSVQAHYLDQGRRERAGFLWRVLCISFVSSVNKLIFLTFDLTFLYPIYTSNTERWWVSKKSFHMFTIAKTWTNKVMGAIWFLFFQRQMVVFWMQRCFQKQWCETKPLFAEIAGPLLWRLVATWAAAHPENWKVATRRVSVSSAALLLTNHHGTAAAPGPGSRAQDHTLYITGVRAPARQCSVGTRTDNTGQVTNTT